LDYINMLDRIDTSQIPPTAQVLSHLNVTRPDKAVESLSTEAVLANAPTIEGAFIRIPAVLEEFKPTKTDNSGSEASDA
ncbi:MAG: Asp-tRNA(Asn)/Glu-tRNA(Gln) amidotransferase subunit GatC, partial [Chloroflexia bacterium]